MRIRNGERTDEPIRRSLREDEREDKDYYTKADPNFSSGTYSVCHRKLRQVIRPGDVLFFRTLWRGQQYLIGYFRIKSKRGSLLNPTLVADLKKSRLVHFKVPITLKLAQIINPEMHFRDGVHCNSSFNGRLGRNYKRTDTEVACVLIELIEANKNNAA